MAIHDEEWGQTLWGYHTYLLLLARLQMPRHLQAKFDPEDVVTQTVEKAIRSKETYNDETKGGMAAWLRKILANTMRDHIRHWSKGPERSLEENLARSSQRLEALLEASQTSPSGQVSREEQLRRLAEALKQLSEVERQVLTQRWLQDRSVREVAEHMDLHP